MNQKQRETMNLHETMNQREALNQKQQLVKVVFDLFEEQGSGFKMDDVAKVMQMSKKTIYKEYGNKEDLLMLVVEATFRSIEKQLELIMQNNQYTSLEKLIHVICAFPEAKEVDYHKAIMLKKDFPQPYMMFIHYIEDNWDLTHKLFDLAIEEKFIKTIDFDIFRNIVRGITKQILDSDYDDQELVLNRCIHQVFEGFVL